MSNVESTLNRKLVKFFQYIKKKATAFGFYYDAKHSDTLWGSIQVRCYLFLEGCGQKWVWPLREL